MFSRMERQSVPLSTYLTQPSCFSLCGSRAPLSSDILPGRGQVPFHTGLPQSLFSPLPRQARGPLFSPLPVRTSQRECPILKADLQVITNKNNTSLVSVPKGLGRMIEIPKTLKRRKKMGPSRQPSRLAVLRVTRGDSIGVIVFVLSKKSLCPWVQAG